MRKIVKWSCFQPSSVPPFQILENFKSYADVREIGPFHHQFTSVVGPNGSGKSNVIDALLFVFGKRAKQLRLNKVSELIHKSAGKTPQYAKVSVYMQEIVDVVGKNGQPDSYRIVPNTEVILTRIARKDNSSQYQLNHKNCPFKEVVTFLSARGIDLDHNRFLILQGEVELISMMPPKGKTPDDDHGLLEYLEDMIGSHKFVQPIRDVAEQLEVLQEQRNEKLQRVKAMAKEKDSLTAAKMEAEELLSKEREIRQQSNILCQLQQRVALLEKESLVLQEQQLQTELAVEQERFQVGNKQVEEIEAGLAEQRAEYQSVYQEMLKTKEEWAAFERRDIKLKEDIKHTKLLIQECKVKAQSELDKHDAAVGKGKEATAQIPELDEKLTQVQTQHQQAQSDLQTLHDKGRQRTRDLRRQLEVESKELLPLQEEQSQYQNRLETAETAVRLVQEKTENARTKLVEAQDELNNLESNKQAKRDELGQCQEELVQAEQRIEEATAEEQMIAKKQEKLSQKRMELVVCICSWMFGYLGCQALTSSLSLL